LRALISTETKAIVFAITLLSMLTLTIICVTSAYAGTDKLTDSLKEATSSGTEDIIEKVDEGGFKAVTTIRSVAIVAAVIFLVWAGIIFWGAGGNPGKISEAKSKLIWFFIALVFIFMAENIFATLADFFGIDLN